MLLARISPEQLDGWLQLLFLWVVLAWFVLLGCVFPALMRWSRRRAISQLGELWAEYPLAEPVISFSSFATPARKERWQRWKGRFLLGYFLLGSLAVVLADDWQQRLGFVTSGWLMASAYVFPPRAMSSNRLFGPLSVGQHGLIHADGFLPWTNVREMRVDSSPGSPPEAPTRVVIRLSRSRGEIWLTARDAQALFRLVVERVSPSLCSGNPYAQAG